MTTILQRAMEYVATGNGMGEDELSMIISMEVDADIPGDLFARLLAGGAIASGNQAVIERQVTEHEGGKVHSVVMADAYSTKDAV